MRGSSMHSSIHNFYGAFNSLTGATSDLSDVMRKDPTTFSPVFRYNSIQHTFTFAGSFLNLNDPQTKRSTNLGHHVVCQLESDCAVVINGASDESVCVKFQNAFLRILAITAASSPGKMDPNSPNMDTPVYNKNEDGLKKTGDLSNIPKEVKRLFKSGNFTVCDYVGYARTRLSEGQHKRVGAVIAGTTNEDVCYQLYEERIKKQK